MKILDPNKSRQLRAMIAKTLDKASTEAEQHGSALAAIRLLAEFGLGVNSESIDPDKTEQLVLMMPAELPETEPLQRFNDLFDDLFGAAVSYMNDMDARQRQRRAHAAVRDAAASETDPQKAAQKAADAYVRQYGREYSHSGFGGPIPFGGRRRPPR